MTVNMKESGSCVVLIVKLDHLQKEVVRCMLVLYSREYLSTFDKKLNVKSKFQLLVQRGFVIENDVVYSFSVQQTRPYYLVVPASRA
jgi:hypothetical protein